MTLKNGLPCVKCGTSEWYKKGSCVTCTKESGRRWRAANPDRKAERLRRWHAENPEKAREYNRRYEAANPDKRHESRRRWRLANPDKNREASSRYRASNPEKVKANNHRRRTRKTEAGGSFTAAEWKALVAHQDGRCLACGKETRLTVDHIVPVSKGGSSNIENVQGLCTSCNSSKKDRIADYRRDGGFLR